MFNPNSVDDSRRFDLRQFRDYPQTPSESFKQKPIEIMKGNELDYEKASKIVLEEFRNGKLGKISLETPEEGTKEA